MSDWVPAEIPMHTPTGMMSCGGIRSGSLGVHSFASGFDQVWSLTAIPSGIQIGLFVSRDHAAAAGDIANRITDWSSFETALRDGQMYATDPATWNPLLERTSKAWAAAGLGIAIWGANHWSGRNVYAFALNPIAGTA